MEQKHFRASGSSGGHGRPFRNGKPGVSRGGYKGSRPSHGPSRFGGGSRGGYAGSRGGTSRGGNRGGRGGGFSKYIDVSKFVNKAVITEKTEHFTPEHAFTDFLIDTRLKTNIATKGYFVPTPIQDKIIPHILRGLDVVGIANTGTGKTAAFLIPLIDKILKNPKEKVMIIVPTRELAQQIEQEFMGFAKHMALWSVCCVGGASIIPQLKALGRQYNFVIGTPGRLRDLIERGKIRLSEYSTVVLDEADRMLDMGFITDIKFMLAGMNKVRHTLFFSATMSPEIKALISHFLKEPVSISVKTADTAQSVDQDIVRVPVGKNKLDVLSDLLKQPGFSKVIIFGKTKHGVQRLAEDLLKRGFKAEAIHGNKSQGQRMRALKSFKDHQVQILTATDVAARGLDISGITHVINYDIPATYDDYVHRIGRTGRAGKQGKALTFV
jgi:superfamily II DNA/RNA helicase